MATAKLNHVEPCLRLELGYLLHAGLVISVGNGLASQHIQPTVQRLCCLILHARENVFATNYDLARLFVRQSRLGVYFKYFDDYFDFYTSYKS